MAGKRTPRNRFRGNDDAVSLFSFFTYNYLGIPSPHLQHLFVHDALFFLNPSLSICLQGSLSPFTEGASFVLSFPLNPFIFACLLSKEVIPSYSPIPSRATSLLEVPTLSTLST